ncbi:hypothetical protein M3J09_002522 [Ascochyta lentis]
MEQALLYPCRSALWTSHCTSGSGIDMNILHCWNAVYNAVMSANSTEMHKRAAFIEISPQFYRPRLIPAITRYVESDRLV